MALLYYGEHCGIESTDFRNSFEHYPASKKNALPVKARRTSRRQQPPKHRDLRLTLTPSLQVHCQL